MIKPFLAPDGERIVGILQTVEAVAEIEGIDASTGDPIYTGDATIRWESMKGKLQFGQRFIYVDALGRRWNLTDLHAADGSVGAYIRHRVRSRVQREDPRADADRESSAVSSSGG